MGEVTFNYSHKEEKSKLIKCFYKTLYLLVLVFTRFSCSSICMYSVFYFSMVQLGVQFSSVIVASMQITRLMIIVTITTYNFSSMK